MHLTTRVSVDHAIIAIVIAITLAVHVVSFGYLSSLAAGNPAAYPYPIVSGDSIYYARAANNLLTLHAYQQVPGVPLRGAPPGYPALLAAAKAATGSMTPLVVVQTLFAALAVILLYRMARILLPAAYAAAVALFYALDPMVIFADTTLIKDGLFSALLICIVYLAFFYDRDKATRDETRPATTVLSAAERIHLVLRWGIVGLLLGIAAMISPIGQFLVLVFPAMYLVRTWRSGERYRLWAVCACVVGFALITVPWMARNHMYFGSYEISSLGGYNLLTNDIRGFLGWRALENTPEAVPAILIMRHFDDPIFTTVDEDIAAALAKITPPGGDEESYHGRLAVFYILHDPVRYAYFHAVNTIPFFISSSIASYGQTIRQLRDNTGFYEPTALSLLGNLQQILHPQSVSSFVAAIFALAPTALEIAWWTLVALSAALGVLLRRKNFMVILCAVLVLYFAALTGPMSTSRLRIPAEAYLLILAAVGAHAAVQRTKEKLHQRAEARRAE